MRIFFWYELGRGVFQASYLPFAKISDVSLHIEYKSVRAKGYF